MEAKQPKNLAAEQSTVEPPNEKEACLSPTLPKLKKVAKMEAKQPEVVKLQTGNKVTANYKETVVHYDFSKCYNDHGEKNCWCLVRVTLRLRPATARASAEAVQRYAQLALLILPYPVRSRHRADDQRTSDH